MRREINNLRNMLAMGYSDGGKLHRAMADLLIKMAEKMEQKTGQCGCTPTVKGTDERAA